MQKFTLGIEEEFQILDAKTRDLTNTHHTIIDKGLKIYPDMVKAEMHRSVVEVATRVCADIHEARKEVTMLRKAMIEYAAEENLLISAGGTHPFAKWKEQQITDMERYKEIVEELQDAARSNLIFGLHVHVGLESREVGVFMMNHLRYFLPHIFALSSNSPFWEGGNTGFKSYRTKVFDKFPRTGIPDYFNSAAEYDNYINLLVKTNCIDNGKKIWWDLRLHPFFSTIEFRICDVPLRVDETIAIAALMQALVAKLYKLMRQNQSFRLYSRALINENKWRASRYGINGKMIDFVKEEEVDTKLLINELLYFVDDVVDDLGSRKEINRIHDILKNGTGADRQLEVWNKTKDLKKVVDFMVAETKIGVM